MFSEMKIDGKRLVNLTPHEIVIRLETGDVRIPASGQVARCSSRSEIQPPVRVDYHTIPVTKNVIGDVEGMPEPQDGVIYLVSTMVGQKLAGTRHDVYAPDTSPASAIRDGDGKVVAVKGLQAFQGVIL